MKLHYQVFILIVSLWQSLDAQDLVIGQGVTDGVVITTSSSSTVGSEYNTVDSRGFFPNLNSSSRFLSQATFGSSFEQIENLAVTGLEPWIENQFTIPKTLNLIDKVIELKEAKNSALNTPDAGAWEYYWDIAWWNYHMSSSDELRQRLAFALSEFFVISQFSSFGDNAYALASYYDMLLDNAFGNYRTLLDSVTYHPAMGEYLTYMNNPKTDTVYVMNYEVYPHDTISIQYIFPDENYAREVMQLFSIGLYELNNDGTWKLDGNNNPIPTYDNVDIAEFAKIFTGFSYGDNMAFGYGPVQWEEGFLVPMQIYNDHHEPGEKYLLNGFTVPNRNPIDGYADVADALDNLFNHPNIGPFLGEFLIQRFITSNPSPAYISRVADAFNGDGPFGTVRGDMQSVMKAVLLDEEARSCSIGDLDDTGKLREPFVRYMQLGKAFDLYTTSGEHRNVMENVYDRIQQKPLNSPSVFNFFQRDYQPIGRIEDADKLAPEFQITNTQTISGYLNGLSQWLMDNDYTDVWEAYENEPNVEDLYPALDLADEVELISDETLPQLLERLNVILAHGKLSQKNIDIMIDAIKEFEVEYIDCVAEHTYDCQEALNYCFSYCSDMESDCIEGCNGDQSCIDECISDKGTCDTNCGTVELCETNITNSILNCEQDLLDQRIFRVKLAIYLIMASPEYLINR